MKTIAQVMKKARKGDLLTDEKRVWKVENWGGTRIAVPCEAKSFELWATGRMEKIAIIPRLRIVK